MCKGDPARLPSRPHTRMMFNVYNVPFSAPAIVPKDFVPGREMNAMLP